MALLLVKALEIGVKRHQKKKAEKKAQETGQFYHGSPDNGGQQYPMTEYPPGMGPGTDTNPPQSKREKTANMLTSALRFFQFALGLTVIGLYGRDVRDDHKEHHTWHAKWVFALITAFLASMTALVHILLPMLKRRTATAYSPNSKLRLPQFAGEFVLCILWLTLFGIFGKMYIGVYPVDASSDKKKKVEQEEELGDSSKINRMRHACWVDLVNLVLWAVTASWILLKWLKGRRAGAVVDAEKL